MKKGLVLYKLNDLGVMIIPFTSIILASIKQDSVTVSIKQNVDFTFTTADTINFNEVKKSLIDHFQDESLIIKGESFGN